MADFTRKAIRASFVKLLNEKPLKQITVRDIVDDCGVNRNTFYYHYEDIPHLLGEIIREDSDRIIREHPNIESLDDCIEATISFALEYKKALLHIYRSMSRETYEDAQWAICEYAVSKYMDGVLRGKNVSESDRVLLVDYLKCAFFGIIIGWLESGMKSDIRSSARRLCELKQGELENMIARCTSGRNESSV